ncbi:MAG: cold-shock protein [Terracidiphilus sp.]
MITTGTVKSFNRSKGYGFIRADSGGKDVFVHLSAVQKAGLLGLRKGQRISFEIFDNQGTAAAKNLRMKRTEIDEHTLDGIRKSVTRNARCEMSPKNTDLKKKRTLITRASLELAIVEAVRESDPECQTLMGVIIERVVPKSRGDANWAIKGVKFGKAERDRCAAAISKCVEEVQREFEISD